MIVPSMGGQKVRSKGEKLHHQVKDIEGGFVEEPQV